MALDTFEARYAAFRAELEAPEQRWFDELVCRARRHSHAINRRPHLDFERPVFLAMLLEQAVEVEAARKDLDDLRSRLEELIDALSERGLVVRRLPPPTAEQLDRVGQARLPARAT